MAGGAIGDGVIVDLSRLDAIGAVDVALRTIRCGPGAVRDAVDRAARAVGLRFPVDPSSGAFCTVGGMASTNAAGAHTLRYGAMRAVGGGARLRLRRRLARRAAPRRRRRPHVDRRARALDALAPVLAAESAHAVAARRRAQGLVGLRARRFRRVRRARRPARRERGDARALRRARARARAAAAGTGERARRVRLARGRGGRGGRARARLAPSRASCSTAPSSTSRAAAARVVPVPDDAEAVLLAEVEASSRRGSATALAREIEAEFRAAGATDGAARARSGRRSTRSGSCATRRARSLAGSIPRSKSMQFIEDGCVPPDAAPRVRARRARRARAPPDPRRDLRPRGRRARPRESARRRARAGLAGARRRAARRGHARSRRRSAARSRASTATAGCARRCSRACGRAEALERFAAVKRAFDPGGDPQPGREGRARGRASVRRA